MRGEEFAIVEINGIGGEAIDCWDPRLTMGEVYRRLFDQQRLLFLIGEGNRARGFRPTKGVDFLGAYPADPFDPPLSRLRLSGGRRPSGRPPWAA